MAQTREIRRVALYCRVSTTKQDTPMQVEDLRRMAQARGWEVAAVVEEKASGRKLRPAREQLILDAKAGKYDAIVVWALSRWGRSTADLVNSIRDLYESGVAFISLKEGIDMSTSSGRLVANLLSCIAEFEADLIHERVVAGLRHAQRHGTRSGKAIGRPRTVDQRSIEIRSLAHQGKNAAEIARKVGLGYASVYRVLHPTPRDHK